MLIKIGHQKLIRVQDSLEQNRRYIYEFISIYIYIYTYIYINTYTHMYIIFKCIFLSVTEHSNLFSQE